MTAFFIIVIMLLIVGGLDCFFRNEESDSSDTNFLFILIGLLIIACLTRKSPDEVKEKCSLS